MSSAPSVAFLWVFAFLFAAVELEGAYGWAERLPTWYRVRTRAARTAGLVLRGKPLTGYHLFAIPLGVLAFHLPFLLGLEWSLAEEARVLAAYLVWAIVWDYLWFVLNPAYGPSRFRRGAVWWFPGPWLWRFPLDYYSAVGASVGLAALTWFDGGPGRFYEHLGLLGGFALLTALAVVLSPRYHAWYRHMRRPGSDERSAAPLAPPPEGFASRMGAPSPRDEADPADDADV